MTSAAYVQHCLLTQQRNRFVKVEIPLYELRRNCFRNVTKINEQMTYVLTSGQRKMWVSICPQSYRGPLYSLPQVGFKSRMSTRNELCVYR